MKLAEELRELAKSSREARLQASAKEFADSARNLAKEYSLLGVSCFQNDSPTCMDDFQKEAVRKAVKMLEEDGFWVVMDGKYFAMSWGYERAQSS